MEAPVPPPRKNSKNRLRSSASSRSDLSHQGSRPQSSTKTFEVVHRAEVYTSKSRLLSSSDDERQPPGAAQKKRKRFRKKQSAVKNSSKTGTLAEERQPSGSDDSRKTVVLSTGGRNPPQEKKRGSLTETLSEDSDRRIGLPIPTAIFSGYRKRPSGNATETLSEDSSPSSRSSGLEEGGVKKGREPPEIDKRAEEEPQVKREDPEKEDEIIRSQEPPIPVPRKRTPKGRPPSPQVLSKEVETVVKTESSSSSNSSDDEQKVANKPGEREPKISEENGTASDGHKSVRVTVHGCDPATNKFGRRPVVRMTLVEIGPGHDGRDAELMHSTTTEPCYDTTLGDFRVQWDVDAVVSGGTSDIVHPDSVIFFEILDSDLDVCRAWAFLKLVGANGAVNVGRMLRLQLFKPAKKTNKDAALPTCYYWWSKGSCRAAKRTLFMTVAYVDDEGRMPNQSRGNSSNGRERDRLEESTDGDHGKPSKEGCDGTVRLEPVVWSRLQSQTCKLPNKRMHSLDAGPDGALVLQFSHSGLLLACPTRTAIVLYTFQGQIYLVLSGHTGLVYCVQWSKDDKYLMSASADSTVCVWNIEARNPSPEQVLSHPSYVYSCCWLGGQERRLATGCFDGTLRLWRPSDPKEPEQLLSHHKSRVNCVIAIDPRLVSADAEGVIVIWTERENGSFGLERELKVNELSGKVINKLCPHPNGKRILVQTRDSLLRMLDVKTGAVIQWYQGGVNRKLRMDSGFCGCGSKVLGTSEDGTLCAWQSDTGAQVAIYQLATLAAPPPSAVAFHPRDHVLAVVSHANDFYPSLVVMGYDKNEDGKSVGLVIVDPNLSDNKFAKGDTEEVSKDRVQRAHPPIRVPRESSGRPNKFRDSSFIGKILGQKKKGYDVSAGRLNKGYVEDQEDSSTTVNERESRTLASPGKFVETSIRTKNDGVSSDTRLADIIYQMDTILSKASSKPVSQ